MAELQRGVVKWFNDAKGFGFIEHESGRDIFVHYSIIEAEGFKTLKDGEEVEYELNEGEKGLNASRVIRLSTDTEEKQEATAPTLESGSVPTTTKSAADMIEVENHSTATEDEASLLVAKSETEEDSSSLGH